MPHHALGRFLPNLLCSGVIAAMSQFDRVTTAMHAVVIAQLEAALEQFRQIASDIAG